MTESDRKPEYRPGLEGVPAAKSSISYVGIQTTDRGDQEGVLEYRSIPIQLLAQHSNFLETAFLLIWGRLPTRTELQEFSTDIYSHRRIKYRIKDMMKCFPETGHPMDALQASAAALGLFYSRHTSTQSRLHARQAVLDYWPKFRQWSRHFN